MATLGSLNPRPSIAVVATALAFTVPAGCADELDGVREQGRELREEIEKGTSEQKIRERLDELERDAREEGKAAGGM